MPRFECLPENREVNGWVLHGNWLRAYDAGRARMDSLGIPFGEPEGYDLTGWRRGAEALAWFATMYFRPNAMTREWSKNRFSPNFQIHDKLEAYTPQCYAFFEKIVFDRYLKKKSWLRIGYPADDWPGMCRPPLNEGV